LLKRQRAAVARCRTAARRRHRPGTDQQRRI